MENGHDRHDKRSSVKDDRTSRGRTVLLGDTGPPSSAPFTGQIAVVTGAGSGIGKAIALSLASHGATLCLVGRSRHGLTEVATCLRDGGREAAVCVADLDRDDDLTALVKHLRPDVGCVDILVHAAAVIAVGAIAQAPVRDLDRQYRTNVRAPYALTQALLPALLRTRGQVVFVNSSVIQRLRGTVSQYAATKHALKALADHLREEVNAAGVRVLSIFPGRTATPLQAWLHNAEGKVYRPQLLLQPEDVAAVVVHALALPRTAEVTDISIRPMRNAG
jgi:NADP-dependent 3-hydroxy acid dehydrogenase YdfG